MDKMIKVSPGIARLIKPFVKVQNNAGNARAQVLPANIANIRIGGHTVLDFIRFVKKMANQGKSSPLSLRSADNANYSYVQALQDRIAKLDTENNNLKMEIKQAEQEKNKAFADNQDLKKKVAESDKILGSNYDEHDDDLVKNALREIKNLLKKRGNTIGGALKKKCIEKAKYLLHEYMEVKSGSLSAEIKEILATLNDSKNKTKKGNLKAKYVKDILEKIDKIIEDEV